MLAAQSASQLQRGLGLRRTSGLYGDAARCFSGLQARDAMTAHQHRMDIDSKKTCKEGK